MGRLREGVGLLMALVLGGVLLIVGFAGVMLSRKRRRLRLLKEESIRKRKAEADAWAEAGRRARTPSAQELEDDAMNLDDTRLEQEPPREEGEEP